ncbi:unnamed protein product [Prorocentrum cordatum]|uniref:Exonuclease domain-containing protein n=1 Tax=Prorocentrum cordatum TaxID=2364126 RepID=A0ABN9T922_9DINO|nr:unnamed protein product [Polarella glacialis]
MLYVLRWFGLVGTAPLVLMDYRMPCGSNRVRLVFLYSCYLTLFDDRISSPPSDMLCSLLVFLPKGALQDDCPGRPLHRPAAATRPICLGSADVKILAAACVMPIAANSATLIGEEQKCVSERDMVENVVRAEAWGVEKYMTASSDAALLLTDFASAFPSLAQEWLFFVLEAMGIPSPLVHFFRMMYSDSTAILSLRGRRHGLIRIASGVKQGCPASMFLFVLAVNPLLAWIRASLGSALGLSLGVERISSSLKALLDSLEALAAVANLRLNFRKCQVVVCGTMDTSPIRSLLRSFGAPYNLIQVSLSATYLGFPIGPEGAAQVMCVSKLLFRLQLYPPSQELVSAYRSGVLLLTSGPRNAISYNVATKFSRIGFAAEFLELDAVAKATALRYLLSGSSPRMVTPPLAAAECGLLDQGPGGLLEATEGDLQELQDVAGFATNEGRARMAAALDAALKAGNCVVGLRQAMDSDEASLEERCRTMESRIAEADELGLLVDDSQREIVQERLSELRELAAAAAESATGSTFRVRSTDQLAENKWGQSLGQNRCSNLIFMDLELTAGFYDFHRKPKILECAVLITDKDLKELGRGCWVVGGFSKEELLDLGEFHQIHFRDKLPGGPFPGRPGSLITGNGLFSDVLNSSTTMEEVEEAALSLIRRHCPDPGACPLVGYSVQCDREVLKVEMPQVYRHLSHRIIDVSSFFQMARLWVPERLRLWEGRDSQYNHRALNDVEDSVEALRFARQHLFQNRMDDASGGRAQPGTAVWSPERSRARGFGHSRAEPAQGAQAPGAVAR